MILYPSLDYSITSIDIFQGFGQQPNETIGTLLEIPLRVLSNEECYEDFLRESEQINSQVRKTLYDGITDQILCSKLTCDENDFQNTNEKKFIKCVSYNYLIHYEKKFAKSLAGCLASIS